MKRAQSIGEVVGFLAQYIAKSAVFVSVPFTANCLINELVAPSS